MTLRTIRDYLEDIANHCAFALDLIKQRGPKNFSHDIAFRYALEHVLVILSVAINHLPDDMRHEHPTAPWASIQDLGSRMAYDARKNVSI